MPCRAPFAPFAAWLVLPTVLCGGPLSAATSYPMIESVAPVALQAGTTAELTVHSRYSMEGAYRVLVSGAGVVGEIRSRARVESPPKTARKGKATKTRRTISEESLSVTFRADKDALPGPRDFRIAGAAGVSTVGQLVIVRDPVIAESKDNDTPKTAQAIKLPAAVCGSIDKLEDRDYFKFHVNAGQSFTFRVRGMLLEDRIHDLQLHLDPIITLRGASGSTLAVSDNDLSGDPVLWHRFDRAGDYTLEIRDVRFKGQREWVYCVEISDRPFVRSVFPMAVAAGQHVRFEPVGFQLPAKSTIEWDVPKDWQPGIHRVQLPLAGGLTDPVSLVVCDVPVLRERAGDNNIVKTAQPVSVPAAVNGRIESEGDVDVFSFPAQKGKIYTFEVIARRTGSPLDAVLRLFDAKGRPLTEGDDSNELGHTSADATLETWTAPADGQYSVEIRDLLQRGGPDFVYLLRIGRAEPEFHLYLDTDKTELSPGSRGVLFVNAIRRHGFRGEIGLSVEGLPPGVTAYCEPIPPDERDGMVMFSAPANARPDVANIVVTGTARYRRSDGSTIALRAAALPLQETYVPGGGRGHWPVDSHAVAISERSDLRAVKISKEAIMLHPGESARVDVTIERAPGFVDNVILTPTMDHLGRIYGNTLPAGVVIDGKNSKTLLTASETHGFLTFRAAKTARAAKRSVAVMANVSINFVMKATYSSAPLSVSVAK